MQLGMVPKDEKTSVQSHKPVGCAQVPYLLVLEYQVPAVNQSYSLGELLDIIAIIRELTSPRRI